MSAPERVDGALATRLVEWERRLAARDFASGDRPEQLLAEGCVEFGRTGRVHDRAALLSALAEPSPGPVALADVEVRPMAADVVLVTYRAERRDEATDTIRHTRRSSLWGRRDGRWALAFHQGTPIV